MLRVEASVCYNGLHSTGFRLVVIKRITTQTFGAIRHKTLLQIIPSGTKFEISTAM